MDISFRSATVDDKDFYFVIRKTTIKPYIEKYVGWDEEKEYNNISSKINTEQDKIIIHKGKPIGLYSVNESENDIYVGILNIIVEYQNNSRAIAFYLKNGFEITGLKQASGKYPKIIMECRMHHLYEV